MNNYFFLLENQGVKEQNAQNFKKNLIFNLYFKKKWYLCKS